MATVHYAFEFLHPHTHLVGVGIEVPPHGGPHTDLTLPAWLPGAYKIFDNARNIRNFRAEAPGGAPLRVERLTWQTWRVHDGGEGCAVAYEVFQNKPEIHQGQLNAHHAFLNPGTLACFVVGHQEDWPCTLEVDAPLGWRVATGLTETGENTFTAANYEAFIDCPLEVGLHELATFSQDGVDYEIVYEGTTPFDPETLVAPVKRIVQAATDLWGVPPLERYVFQYLETNAGFLNGLEHRNSTIITGPVADLAQRTGLLAITAHEFFHLWNVKRLHPVGFGPFDYTREAHTNALWIVEGFTEYFTERLVLRAGLQSSEAYLNSLTTLIQQLEAMPGRRNMSLEEASWTTWHFGDDRWNGALNYYVKGALFGAALDLELRGRTANRVSLDDVMRAMWKSHGAQGKPYRTEEVEACAAALLGEPLDAFFDFHLRQREDYDWARIFAHAGLELVVRERLATLGASMQPHEGGMRLENVAAGGPAQHAGLMIGDVLAVIEGERATPVLIEELRHHGEPGQVVEVSYFRRDRLCTATVTLGETRQYALINSPQATEAQQAVRADWLAQKAARASAVR